MTPKQVALVQGSWEHVQPAAKAVAELFYARLFGLDPSLQFLFKGGHYETVGEALLWTLGKGLGPAFSGEMRDAWAAAYRVLSNTMREAAKETA